jgi:hypothetical protein
MEVLDTVLLGKWLNDDGIKTTYVGIRKALKRHIKSKIN